MFCCCDSRNLKLCSLLPILAQFYPTCSLIVKMLFPTQEGCQSATRGPQQGPIQDVLWYSCSTIFPSWKSGDTKMHSWLQNFAPASRIGKMASYHPPCAQNSARWQKPPVLGEPSLGTSMYIINEKLIFSTLNPSETTKVAFITHSSSAWLEGRDGRKTSWETDTSSSKIGSLPASTLISVCQINI